MRGADNELLQSLVLILGTFELVTQIVVHAGWLLAGSSFRVVISVRVPFSKL